MKHDYNNREFLNAAEGDLVRGRARGSFRLHDLKDGSSCRVTGDTILIIIEEHNPGVYFKWKAFHEGKFFFIYDEDIEVVK